MSRHKGAANSAVIIARILGVEGYSNHVHNEVKRWWKHRVMDPRETFRLERIEAEFSEFMRDASESDRLLVGKFIQLRSRQSFDAGFRVGFQALVFEHSAEQTRTVPTERPA